MIDKFIKYLRILIQVNNLASKCSTEIRLHAKSRHCIMYLKILYAQYILVFSLYYFDILIYGSQVWGQINHKHINRLERLENKVIKILNFANYRDYKFSIMLHIV